MVGPPGHWRVRIFEVDGSNEVYGWLGSDPPTAAGGGGGHDQVTLPMRSPVVVWKGRRELIVQTIPMVLGGFADNIRGEDGGRPTVSDRQRLVNMYRPDDPAQEPPVVKIDTLGDAVMFQQLEYVITNLTWGDAEADAEMNRVMQEVTVELTEYEPDVRIRPEHSRAARRSRKGGRMPPVYVVKAGDTLSSIAKHFKVPGGWRAIADAQRPKIRDPRSIHKGQRLRRPS